MRRTVGLLLAFAVFLASGLALTAAAVTLPVQTARLDRSAADTATVRRFYAAVNDALRTGRPPVFDDLVAPEVLRAQTQPGAEPGADVRGGFDRLQTAFAGLELRVEALVADGGHALALVAVDGDRRDLEPGLPIHGSTATWRAVDRFRLDGGRIVAFDRQEQDRDAVSARPLFDAPLARLPATPAVVEVARVTLPPGARLSGLVGPGPELLLLEAGALTARLAARVQPGSTPDGTTDEGQVSLRPGDLLVVPTGAPFAIENHGRVPAVVLEVALRPTAERSPENEGVDAPALGLAALNPGVAVQRLAHGFTADLPAGPATVVATRLTLAPGAGIASHAVDGAELLAVEAGTLGIAVSAGDGKLTRATGADRLIPPTTPASGDGGTVRDGALAAGEGAFLRTGARYAARNTGTEPVVLVVVRVVPDVPAGR